MKQIIKKITICAGSTQMSFIEDYTDYAKTLIECNNIFDSTGEKMTEENINRYFEDGEFLGSKLEDYNGEHFIFGWVEKIAQSGKIPEEVYNYDGEIKFVIEDGKEVFG